MIPEINEMEITNCTNKCWFFEKINKIGKFLAIMTRKRREKMNINKIRDVKGRITTNTNEIQRIMRGYFQNQY
jgi:hypothetical protein